jgi:large subunit ribosomal protein L25
MSKHETPTLAAQTRERLGSRYSQRLRKSGRLPAVIYGHKSNPVAVHLDEKETIGLLKHGVHVINVSVEGGSTETCLVKDLQFGYLGDNVIHVDLARVDLDEEVEVHVHLHFVGSPESAKKPGAILTYDITELEITCKVRDIPEEIRVDISVMSDLFCVKDLKLPENIRCELDSETVIARIGFVAEEAATGEAAETGAASTQPEVITAKKEEGEGEEKKK